MDLSTTNAVTAMDQSTNKGYTAFVGAQRIATGTLSDVAIAVKSRLNRADEPSVLIFSDETGQVVDVDYRGSEDEVRARLSPGSDDTPIPSLAPRGRGRPRLGVVAREVTLLPRHWEWLSKQPGGASAAVRRLVDGARQQNTDKDRVRQAQETAYRFMSAMAGNEPGFEEATRALFAGNEARFIELTEAWPRDVREYARASASRAFAA
jgi:uncharacterized protein